MLALLAVLACEPFGPGEAVDVDELPVEGEARIRLEPDSLDFGTVSVLTEGSATQSFVVRNTESWAVEVMGLDRVAGDSGAFSTDAPAVVQLGPYETLTVQVHFTPATSRDYSGDLFPNGQVTVALGGHGAAPIAALWPDTLDWGSVPVGCDAERSVQLLNAGDEPLQVDRAELITETDFSLADFTQLTLAPGEYSELDLVFSPGLDGLQATVLHVSSNDPADPVSTLDLGGAAYDGDPVSETVAYEPSAYADILLVQDGSSTVATRLEHATQYTQGFLETLDSAGVDWQITLVRADNDCLASPYPWLRSTEGAVRAAEVLNSELTRGSQGDSKLLETAVASLERTDPGDCLDGFLRQDSLLHTVLIGDRPEESPSSAEDYVATMAAKLSTADELVVSAVMGHGTGGCQDLGQAADAVAATGGMDLDLCDADWGDHFAALASIATNEVPQRQSYFLAAEPIPDTLEVWHNGRQLTAWTFDAETRLLTVQGDDEALETGSELTLSYVEASVCSGL